MDESAMASWRHSLKAKGVPMSLEKRPPRELLKKIGISGKEVVTILKQRQWGVDGPKGLRQENLYYAPGPLKTELRQRKHFFVGEGELYAFILKKGGLRYLVPEEEITESDSELEPTQPTVKTEESVEEEDGESSSSDELAGSEQRKWKRRKKLSTGRVKSAEKTGEKTSSSSASSSSSGVEKTVPKKRTPRKRKAAVDSDDDRTLVSPLVKQERATFVGCGQQAEFTEYASSLTAKGWRAQLLQDMDVHLLRAVAEVDRRQRPSSEPKKKIARPTEGVGPHAKDAAEVLQEMDRLMYSIRAAQDDLSFMTESIIAQGERLNGPDRIDPVGHIGIPGFVSTGPENLVLMRDIERYLLLFGAAVRRYQRTRRTVSGESAGASQSSSRPVKRADLRALQLKIEESKSELQDLATMIDGKVRKQSRSSDTSQETAPSSSSPVRADGTDL